MPKNNFLQLSLFGKSVGQSYKESNLLAKSVFFLALYHLYQAYKAYKDDDKNKMFNCLFASAFWSFIGYDEVKNPIQKLRK